MQLLYTQGRAPNLVTAMGQKLLMILIDTPMKWDVPKKSSKNCTMGRRPYIARKLKNLKSSQLPSSCTQIASNNFLAILDSQKTSLKISYS